MNKFFKGLLYTSSELIGPTSCLGSDNIGIRRSGEILVAMREALKEIKINRDL